MARVTGQEFLEECRRFREMLSEAKWTTEDWWNAFRALGWQLTKVDPADKKENKMCVNIFESCQTELVMRTAIVETQPLRDLTEV